MIRYEVNGNRVYRIVRDLMGNRVQCSYKEINDVKLVGLNQDTLESLFENGTNIERWR